MYSSAVLPQGAPCAPTVTAHLMTVISTPSSAGHRRRAFCAVRSSAGGDGGVGGTGRAGDERGRGEAEPYVALRPSLSTRMQAGTSARCRLSAGHSVGSSATTSSHVAERTQGVSSFCGSGRPGRRSCAAAARGLADRSARLQGVCLQILVPAHVSPWTYDGGVVRIMPQQIAGCWNEYPAP